MKIALIALQIGIQLLSYVIIARICYRLGLMRGYRCWLRACRHNPDIVKALATLDRIVPESSKLVDAHHELTDSAEAMAGLRQQQNRPTSRFGQN